MPQIIRMINIFFIGARSIRAPTNPTALIIQTIKIDPNTMAIIVPMRVSDRLRQVAILECCSRGAEIIVVRAGLGGVGIGYGVGCDGPVVG